MPHRQRDSNATPDLHRSHFSIYGPAVKMEWLVIQTGWIAKLQSTLLQFSSVSSIDDRFWHGEVEFAWRGALVNAQPYKEKIALLWKQARKWSEENSRWFYQQT
ncbi:hypothetical protein AVEN_185363-1 [Araneus ventricosus]|uniref:Uncharacterized protein n=1 Tax=Araneus ventricosus TaxID=182803 RepID=A0A4Y2HRS5_ARAVE|nr:hypothetical protein AVEN_185363-1 [Araneus ventricosus]